MNQPTPAIVTQSAVRRLPRLALLLFCVAYVLPGFLGREPWKVADVTAFGVMLDLAMGAGNGWMSATLNLAGAEPGPLPYWLGAAFIRLLPVLSPDVAVRIPFAALLGLTLACTWYTVYHLARQPAAQPVAFAFGGEAQPTDYARTLADAGLLALVACLGLAQLSHETTPDLARLAWGSLLLLGASRLAHAEPRHPTWSLWLWGLGVVTLVLSGAAWTALVLGLGLLAVLWSTRGESPGRSRLLAMAAGIWGLPLIAAAWAGWLPTPSLLPGLSQLRLDNWGQLLLWFTWPSWPLVVLTLWRWRRQLAQPHVALPLWALLVGVASSALDTDRDRALLIALPAFAALAAFALPTLRRSVSALIDWFTLLFFSGCALIIWVVWVAMQTGVPAKPAANVAKLAPGFNAEFSLGLFLIGALATLAWLWLVSWRVGQHRQALWKSLVLPAAGSTLCWLLLMTLWLPLLDHARSYGPISRRIASLVPADRCVLVDGLSPAQMTALRYHGGLRLESSSAAKGTDCAALVVTPGNQPSLAERVDLTQWAFRATVRRLSDSKESLLIYQRISR